MMTGNGCLFEKIIIHDTIKLNHFMLLYAAHFRILPPVIMAIRFFNLFSIADLYKFSFYHFIKKAFAEAHVR